MGEIGDALCGKINSWGLLSIFGEVNGSFLPLA